ncbi:hypothetical protein JOE32_000980 [Pseudomonas sp. PvP025]|uniref:Uncharacterized protein n=1 Tax=Pseudomonas trivialis TaxID=200450 RepID=A0ABY0UM99_9PSED|nr:hypothetical protein [Pseudomonas sp. PvP025]MDQ0398373.1 hypothetical protein [Pseudomonas sp. PvP006]SDS89906.1 hypothetical protein SAMN04490205_4015 [Pseudomonas trivialis]
MSITDSGAFIREVKKAPQIFYTIHYSCQSLYDDNEGLSPVSPPLPLRYRSGR